MESYLIQSSIALAIFYILFRVIIYKESNQQLKRLMGVCIALFCSFFLLAPVHLEEPKDDFPLVVQNVIDNANTIQSSLTFAPQKETSVWAIVYTIGASIFLVRFLIGFAGIIRLYTTSVVSKKWDFILVETEKTISPFSFFNLLFIKKGEIDKPGLAPIILHEKFHKDQMHSVDAMLLELLSILFWFNPFMWLLKRDVKASHEYLADDYVVSSEGFDKLEYQNLLFKARTGVSFSTVNYLSNQTSLKQRFNMMEKSKIHSKTGFLRAGTIIAAMALAVFVSSFTNISGDDIGKGDLDIRLFTSDGPVDLEKGISRNTEKLFLRMVPRKGETLKYRVSKSELTVVVGGVGQKKIQSGDVVTLTDSGIANSAENSSLVLEIKEYQTLNTDNIVELYKLKEGVFFSIPIY